MSPCWFHVQNGISSRKALRGTLEDNMSTYNWCEDDVWLALHLLIFKVNTHLQFIGTYSLGFCRLCCHCHHPHIPLCAVPCWFYLPVKLIIYSLKTLIVKRLGKHHFLWKNLVGCVLKTIRWKWICMQNECQIDILTHYDASIGIKRKDKINLNILCHIFFAGKYDFKMIACQRPF